MNFRQLLRNRALVALMVGHLTNDLFAGILPILFPAMKLKFGLDNAQLGLVTLAFAGTASIVQPFFGHLLDSHARRWIPVVTVLWCSIFVSLYGFAPTYGIWIAIAAAAGLGSGLFHPTGATLAAANVDDRSRNSALSLYTVGGTTGYSIGPIVAAFLIGWFGPRGTAGFLLIGVIAAILLAGQLRSVKVNHRPKGGFPGEVAVPVQWLAISKILGITMLRAWGGLAVMQFVPVWLDGLGYSSKLYGPLTTDIILAGAAGTLVGGAIADRVGGRTVLFVSLTLAIPALVLLVSTPGPWAFLTGALFGFLTDFSLSVTLVEAQRLLPGRTGIASGVILGLGFITGGIGVPITGWISDSIGIEKALLSLVVLYVLAALLSLTLPKTRHAFIEPPMPVGGTP